MVALKKHNKMMITLLADLFKSEMWKQLALI